MCALACLAVMMIAGLFSAGPALAHNGHFHAAPTAVDSVDRVAVDEVALAVAELSRILPPAADEPPITSSPSPSRDRNPACDGHCCASTGAHCCGFLAASLHVARSEYLISPHLGEWSAHVLDGLGPEALLRPPRSLI